MMHRFTSLPPLLLRTESLAEKDATKHEIHWAANEENLQLKELLADTNQKFSERCEQLTDEKKRLQKLLERISATAEMREAEDRARLQVDQAKRMVSQRNRNRLSFALCVHSFFSSTNFSVKEKHKLLEHLKVQYLSVEKCLLQLRSASVFFASTHHYFGSCTVDKTFGGIVYTL